MNPQHVIQVLEEIQDLAASDPHASENVDQIYKLSTEALMFLNGESTDVDFFEKTENGFTFFEDSPAEIPA